MDIEFFTLGTPEGIELTVSNLGASIIGLVCEDKEGVRADVVVGPETPEQLIANPAFMGGTVGRFANRIARGKYIYEGETVQLSINDGMNHLHGGVKGIHKTLWNVDSKGEREIIFSLTSVDGEDGYPGTLEMQVIYQLVSNDTFLVKYSAKSDKATPVNLAQHAYWNLTGDPTQKIINHFIQSDSVKGFLEVSDEVMPTGRIVDSVGTVFDFSQPRELRVGLESADEQLKKAGGYDHCLVFDDRVKSTLVHIISVVELQSGRTLDISTNMPAAQLYSGNFLDGSFIGKGGAVHHRTGFCIETQHYPDAVNFEHFPSPILKPNEAYEHVIEYVFATT